MVGVTPRLGAMYVARPPHSGGNKVSFHVGCLPIRFQWKCRFFLVEYTFPLEFSGQQLTRKLTLITNVDDIW